MTIEDGVQLQGSVIGRGATLGAGASVRDCHIGPGVAVEPGAELRNEAVGHQ